MQLPLAGHRHVLGVYLRPQWGRVLLLALLILLSIGLQLVNPQIIRYFIDATQQAGASPAIVAAALLYLLVGLAQHGAALATVALSLDVGWRATNALRADLLRHVLGLDMTFHKAYTPGALIERVDGDVSALGDFFAQFLVRVAANVLLIAAILVIVLRTNALAGAALLVYTVLTVIVLVFVQRIGVVRWNAAREAWSDQMGFIEEHYAGAEDLRGVGAEPYVLYRLFGYMRALTEQARSGWMAQALGYALTNFLYVAGYALGLALGAWLYTQGQVTIGTAFVLVYYVGMLADPLEALRGQGEILQQATVGVRRVGSLLNQQSQIATAGTRTLPDGPLTVEVDTVTFTYTDTSPQSPTTPIPQHLTPSPPHPLIPSSPHLDTLSFTLPASRTLGVLGRTGSGKTTLTRLLYRLYDPDDGTIRLDGVDLRAVAHDELRRRVGVVTQDVQLFHATLRDNITFFDPQIDDAAIEAALAELGLLDWVRAMPDGLDTMLASGGHGFSAGEAQLLAFTRLLLRDPGLVILDEAASRLDPVTERRLEGAIDRLLDNRTAVIVAHRLHTVQRADDILILENGAIVEYGARRVLAADPSSRFARLLQSGLEEVLA
ncbi:MAG: ABC transporter ATP-binding protein [Caldilineaceae bacterium]|nr:ABC transporter ATP-binding protein [Caldilineaceae bacterium]MCB9125718.1 ABC transporter ATP-binding protein [Caldilineaceae bacterium]